jgi:hypothetical protein
MPSCASEGLGMVCQQKGFYAALLERYGCVLFDPERDVVKAAFSSLIFLRVDCKNEKQTVIKRSSERVHSFQEFTAPGCEG